MKESNLFTPEYFLSDSQEAKTIIFHYVKAMKEVRGEDKIIQAGDNQQEKLLNFCIMHAKKSYDFFKKTRLDLEDIHRAFGKAMNEPKF